MAVISCVLWGSAFPVLKVTYRELGLGVEDNFGRMLLAGGRFFLAGIMVLVAVKFIFRQSIRVERHWLGPLFRLGLFQTGLQYFFFYNGIARTSGIKSAILNSIGNFFVVILAHFIYRNDRLNWGKIIGLATGFAGIVLINWQPGAGVSWDMSLLGEGLLVLSGLTSAIGTFQAKQLSQSLSPVVINAYQFLFGSLLLLLAGMPGLARGGLTPSPLFWGLFIYSAFLSAAAFSIWYSLLKYNKPGEVTLFRFMIPVAGAVLSSLLLPGENLTPRAWLALLLVAFGIAVVNYGQRRRRFEAALSNNEP